MQCANKITMADDDPVSDASFSDEETEEPSAPVVVTFPRSDLVLDGIEIPQLMTRLRESDAAVIKSAIDALVQEKRDIDARIQRCLRTLPPNQTMFAQRSLCAMVIQLGMDADFTRRHLQASPSLATYFVRIGKVGKVFCEFEANLEAQIEVLRELADMYTVEQYVPYLNRYSMIKSSALTNPTRAATFSASVSRLSKMSSSNILAEAVLRDVVGVTTTISPPAITSGPEAEPAPKPSAPPRKRTRKEPDLNTVTKEPAVSTEDGMI